MLSDDRERFLLRCRVPKNHETAILFGVKLEDMDRDMLIAAVRFAWYKIGEYHGLHLRD